MSQRDSPDRSPEVEKPKTHHPTGARSKLEQEAATDLSSPASSRIDPGSSPRQGPADSKTDTKKETSSGGTEKFGLKRHAQSGGSSEEGKGDRDSATTLLPKLEIYDAKTDKSGKALKIIDASPADKDNHEKNIHGRAPGQPQIDIDDLARHPEKIDGLNPNESKDLFKFLLSEALNRGYRPRVRALAGADEKNPDNPFVDPDDLYRPGEPAKMDLLKLHQAQLQAPNAKDGIADDLVDQLRREESFKRDPFGLQQQMSRFFKSEDELKGDAQALELELATPEQKRQKIQLDNIKLAGFRDPDNRDPNTLLLRLKEPLSELTPEQDRFLVEEDEVRATLALYDAVAKHYDQRQAQYDANGWSPDSLKTDDKEFLADIASKHSAKVSDYDKFKGLFAIDRIKEQNPEIFASNVDQKTLNPEQQKMRSDIEKQEHDLRTQVVSRLRHEATRLDIALGNQQGRQGVTSNLADSLAGSMGTPGGWGGMFLDSDATSTAVKTHMEEARQATATLLSLPEREFLGKNQNLQFANNYHLAKGDLRDSLEQAYDSLDQLAKAQEGRVEGVSDTAGGVASLLACCAGNPELSIPLSSAAKVGVKSLEFSTVANAGEGYTVGEMTKDAFITGVSNAPFMPGNALITASRNRLMGQLGRQGLRQIAHEAEEGVVRQSLVRTLASQTKELGTEAAKQFRSLTPRAALQGTLNLSGRALGAEGKYASAGAMDGAVTEGLRAVIDGKDPIPAAMQGGVGGLIMGPVLGPVIDGVGRTAQHVSSTHKEITTNNRALEDANRARTQPRLPEPEPHPAITSAEQPIILHREEGSSTPSGTDSPDTTSSMRIRIDASHETHPAGPHPPADAPAVVPISSPLQSRPGLSRDSAPVSPQNNRANSQGDATDGANSSPKDRVPPVEVGDAARNRRRMTPSSEDSGEGVPRRLSRVEENEQLDALTASNDIDGVKRLALESNYGDVADNALREIHFFDVPVEQRIQIYQEIARSDSLAAVEAMSVLSNLSKTHPGCDAIKWERMENGEVSNLVRLGKADHTNVASLFNGIEGHETAARNFFASLDAKPTIKSDVCRDLLTTNEFGDWRRPEIPESMRLDAIEFLAKNDANSRENLLYSLNLVDPKLLEKPNPLKVSAVNKPAYAERATQALKEFYTSEAQRTGKTETVSPLVVADKLAQFSERLKNIPTDGDWEDHLYQEIDGLSAELGIPELGVAILDPPEAGAGRNTGGYTFGDGIADFTRPSIEPGEPIPVQFLQEILHEFGHFEQDILIGRSFADNIAKRGLSSEAEQLEALGAEYDKIFGGKFDHSEKHLRAVWQHHKEKGPLTEGEQIRAEKLKKSYTDWFENWRGKGEKLNNQIDNISSSMKAIEAGNLEPESVFGPTYDPAKSFVENAKLSAQTVGLSRRQISELEYAQTQGEITPEAAEELSRLYQKRYSDLQGEYREVYREPMHEQESWEIGRRISFFVNAK